MPKVEIDVDQILTSAVVIDEVQVGDRLMVMNGVIIGLVERRAIRPIEVPKVVPKAIPKAIPKASPKLRDHDAAMATRLYVIDALKDTSPMTALEISLWLEKNMSGIPRVAIKRAIVRLRKRGIIEPISQSRFSPYRLAEQKQEGNGRMLAF